MTEHLMLTPEDAALLLKVLETPAPVTAYSALLCPEAQKLVDLLRAHAALVPPPLNGDKVWGDLTIGLVRMAKSQNQERIVIRAKTKAEAFRMLRGLPYLGRTSTGYFQKYWCETTKREELLAATERGVYMKGPEGWIKVV